MSAGPDAIPVEHILPHLKSWLADNEKRPDDSHEVHPITVLAEKTGLHADTLRQYLMGRRVTISFSRADSILCAVGMVTAWFEPPLNELYRTIAFERAPAEKKVLESRPCVICDKPFEAIARVVTCSKECSKAHKKQHEKERSAGKRREAGIDIRKITCEKGHVRTARKGTHTDPDGNKVCLLCWEESARKTEKTAILVVEVFKEERAA